MYALSIDKACLKGPSSNLISDNEKEYALGGKIDLTFMSGSFLMGRYDCEKTRDKGQGTRHKTTTILMN
jgi:hypothetical protein